MKSKKISYVKYLNQEDLVQIVAKLMHVDPELLTVTQNALIAPARASIHLKWSDGKEELEIYAKIGQFDCTIYTLEGNEVLSNYSYQKKFADIMSEIIRMKYRKGAFNFNPKQYKIDYNTYAQAKLEQKIRKEQTYDDTSLFELN